MGRSEQGRPRPREKLRSPTEGSFGRPDPAQPSAVAVASAGACRTHGAPAPPSPIRGPRAPDPPFRALRFEPDVVGDLRAVVSPPYDVISAPEQQRLLARDPRNVVRLDLPADEPGDGPDDRYRRAARTFAAWRSDGSFRKDPRPPVRLRADVPRAGDRRRADPARLLRTVAARAVRAGRPGAAPRADPRRAQGGPLQAAPRDRGEHQPGRRAVRRPERARRPAFLAALARGPAGDRPRRRRRRPPPPVGRRRPTDRRRGRRRASSSRPRRAEPITIADGHHRYETALRYRDERRMSRSCEEDPAVRLHPDAVPRDHRGAADGAADPSRGARARRRRVAAGCGPGWRSCSTSSAADRAERSTRLRSGRRWRPAARAGSGCGRATAARS